ncbi:disease resistance protein RPV1-like [Corylus avellana]|uniref:disease resistance protein RPV1-like n=1 Tax=Corylus avellana TaxID=13451 RepID=UPI002869F99E|nr:disease resistance protein RPV1-like [Corylus avellana]
MTSLQGASSSSSSPSSPSTNLRPYDVFLSFRGEDTRTNFTAYLFKALCQNGINTFKDDEQLKSGEEISPTLLNAIKESKISIIIFSKSYASSKWCLNELTKILECKQMKGQRVLPVFYRVDPSDVRNQTKSFGEAFNELEEKFKDDKIKVQTWKTALTKVADLSGEVLGNRNEPELIDDIIKWVNSILVKNPCFQVAIYPVGIESRVEAVKSHLDIEKNDITCMVGIFGIGGIGKTTIAKAIYNSIASQFEGGSCFLENIRDKADQKDGLVRLQDELLSNILGESISMVENIDQRITLIKQRLCNLRIFLVLDDVDQPNQLEKLAGKGDWFGLGSRIIITTRDKHLLTVHGVDSTYQMNKLDDNEDLELFSFHASIKDKSNDDYVEVTKNALRYAGGLPLALIVVGSALKGRDIPYWKSKLDEYKKIPPNDIQKKLQISYDGLCRNAQDIFLHIACFFKGENVKYVKKILDSCGFYPDSGIKELEDKCLITQSCGSLMIHGLVQEMGREIVRQVSPYNPGRRTRLWFHEEVRDVLEDNTGTNSVEGILIDLPGEDLTHLSSNAFMEMKRLRLFISHNARLSEELNFSSNQLRLLYWPEYPGESLPSNFCGRKLAVLRMPKSLLKGLEGVEVQLLF